jgi:hypothetical protein
MTRQALLHPLLKFFRSKRFRSSDYISFGIFEVTAELESVNGVNELVGGLTSSPLRPQHPGPRGEIIAPLRFQPGLLEVLLP